MNDLKINFADTPRTQNPPQALDYWSGAAQTENTVRHTKCGRIRGMVVVDGVRLPCEVPQKWTQLTLMCTFSIHGPMTSNAFNGT